MTTDRTRIKICGIRDVEAAVAASNAGADYLGFNFIEGVRRQIQPDEGAGIVSEYRQAGNSSTAKPVGLFRNQPADFVNETARLAGLEWLQLCGDEDDGYFAQMEFPVFKQVRVREGITSDVLRQQVSHHLNANRSVVLDSYDKKTLGGSGRTFDWAAAQGVANLENVLLAGGLNPENVQNAIKQLSPWGVDVSSGVETGGEKNPERIRAFIEAVQTADRIS